MKIFSYVTGVVALLIVATAAVLAALFAAQHTAETLKNLAVSTLQGIGMSVGGLLGSALVMRFQVARDYVKKLVGEVKK
jgi:hypothetical protein